MGRIVATDPAGPLEQTLASHAMIHTADGQHFRDALAAASEALGLKVVRLRPAEAGRQDPLRPACPSWSSTCPSGGVQRSMIGVSK